MQVNIEDAAAEVRCLHAAAETAIAEFTRAFDQVNGLMVGNEPPASERRRAVMEDTKAQLGQMVQTADAWRAVASSWATLAGQEEKE